METLYTHVNFHLSMNNKKILFNAVMVNYIKIWEIIMNGVILYFGEPCVLLSKKN